MTAKFAGSGSLDDRRRRRLAQESTADSTTNSEQRRRQPKTAHAHERSEEIPAVRSDVVAAESIVPASIWKVFAVSGTAFAFWGGLVWMNLQSGLPIAFEAVFQPKIGSGFHFLSVLALFETSQLAFLIYWYRSRSRKDFGGRYRVWGWAGLFWAIVCFSKALEVHEPLATLAAARWPVHFWRPGILYWFVPFSIGVLALHQLLALDMRLSKLSQSLWAATLTIGLFSACLTLGLDFLFPESIRDLIGAAAATCWQLLVMTTMLIHARFVVHVTNEAAPKRKALLRRAVDVIRIRTATLSQGLSSWSTCRVEKRRERLERVAHAKAERREKLQAQRVEKEKIAKAKREEIIADKKTRQAEAKRKRTERLEQQRAAKAERLAQKEAAKVEREQAAAEKKAQQNAEKSVASKPKDVDSKSVKQATPATQTDADTKVADTPSADQSSTSDNRKRKRVMGRNLHIDPAESNKKPHISSNRQEFDSDDDDDYEESPPMSKKERRRLRKQKRQRSS